MLKKLNRKMKILIAVILAIGIGLIMLDRIFELTHTMTLSTGTVRFYDEEKGVIEQELNKIDETIIKLILNYKILYTDSPSCGFSEDASIVFDGGDRKFYVASDTCPLIYDEKADKYFRITLVDKGILYGVLKKYGFYFPCV